MEMEKLTNYQLIEELRRRLNLEYPKIEKKIEETEVKMQTELKSSTPTQPKEEKQQYPAICSTCGENTLVPFKPTAGWKVLCPICYTNKMNGVKKNE